MTAPMRRAPRSMRQGAAAGLHRTPLLGRVDRCGHILTPIRRRNRCHWLVLPWVALGLLQGVGSAQTLRGSAASLDRQTAQAERHDFTYLSGTRQLRRFVNAGLLVAIGGNRDYTLHAVSFPVARPQVRLFIERLAAQVSPGVYRATGGDQPDPSAIAPTPQCLRVVRPSDRDGYRPSSSRRDLPAVAGAHAPLFGVPRGARSDGRTPPAALSRRPFPRPIRGVCRPPVQRAGNR